MTITTERVITYSVVLQAIVDCNYEFIDINVGCTGKVHDARVFRNSPHFLFGERGLLPGESKNINGVQIHVPFIGDATYPLLNWMMTPYKGNIK